MVENLVSLDIMAIAERMKTKNEIARFRDALPLPEQQIAAQHVLDSRMHEMRIWCYQQYYKKDRTKSVDEIMKKSVIMYAREAASIYGGKYIDLYAEVCTWK